MAAIQQARPFSLVSDHVWAGLSARSHWRGTLMVVHCRGVIRPDPLTWLAAVIMVGARQSGLAIPMHEASHGTRRANTKLHAFVGGYLCVITGCAAGGLAGAGGGGAVLCAFVSRTPFIHCGTVL
jgi:fatty acid desaturase